MAEKNARGRPAADEGQVREKVLNAAFLIIVEQDISFLTIDEIARRAALAKKTIYRFYSNKEAIIESMIARWTSTTEVPEPAKPTSSEQVVASLNTFFTTLAARVLSLESVVIYQFLQSDLSKKSEYLKLYRENGFDNAARLLDKWLHEVKASGLINPLWPVDSAHYLQALIVTPLLRDISLGLIPPVPVFDVQPTITRILNDFSPLMLARPREKHLLAAHYTLKQ